MGEAKLSYYTIEEYLVQEERSEFKSEYVDGTIQAMSGVSFNHGFIGGNVYHEIKLHIEGEQLNCTPINSDIRLFIDSANSFVYPDVAVVCGDLEESVNDENAYTNPVLIVEVLSKSTESYDRGDKFRRYRSLPSFKEYVLIDQYKPIVEVFYREEKDYWQMITIIGLDKSIYLNSLDCYIAMKDLYSKVRNLQHPNG